MQAQNADSAIGGIWPLEGARDSQKALRIALLASMQRAATTAITSIGLVLPASTMPVGRSHRITRSGDFFSLPFTRLSDAELIKSGDGVFTGREPHITGIK